MKNLISFGIIGGIVLNAPAVFGAVTNKSSTFSTQLSKSSDGSETTESALSASIKSQRAALDRADAESGIRVKSSSTRNECDETLRTCMSTKCGSDYAKCATDIEIIFSDKLTSCNRDNVCSGREFNLFTNEIKEDKKQAVLLANYNRTMDCGAKYNSCIIDVCGPKFNKCLGKSAGDKALAQCKSIATECTESDSGMPGRIGNIFGTVRVDAEKQIKSDEAKLTSLRKDMRTSCESIGAMFDERSLDCVFTVSFMAGTGDEQINASKKLYAGSVFDCTPDWFGIDVTTFQENAYRLTRAQTGASAAMLGSGLGIGVGAVASGAIDRARETKRALDALKEACGGESGMVFKDGKCVDATEGGIKGLLSLLKGSSDGEKALQDAGIDEIDLNQIDENNPRVKRACKNDFIKNLLIRKQLATEEQINQVCNSAESASGTPTKNQGSKNTPAQTEEPDKDQKKNEIKKEKETAETDSKNDKPKKEKKSKEQSNVQDKVIGVVSDDALGWIAGATAHDAIKAPVEYIDKKSGNNQDYAYVFQNIKNNRFVLVCCHKNPNGLSSCKGNGQFNTKPDISDPNLRCKNVLDKTKKQNETDIKDNQTLWNSIQKQSGVTGNMIVADKNGKKIAAAYSNNSSITVVCCNNASIASNHTFKGDCKTNPAASDEAARRSVFACTK